MNKLIIYLLEINMILLVMYTAFRLLFEKDRNFLIRRIYLLGIPALSLLLPLIPETIRAAASKLSPVAITLDEVTIYAYAPEQVSSGSWFSWNILLYLYLGILALGLCRLGIQLFAVFRTISRSERSSFNGRTIISSSFLHASSFFGYIFLNPESLGDADSKHIMGHEEIHLRERHSLDRLVTEIFVLINWFNPVAWMYRMSVIRNLEYLADAAMVREGADNYQYQLSILNQYMGSASITNQFSSQIKKRIHMLNRNYRMGSSWKIALIFPLLCIAFIAISCSDKETDRDEVFAVNPESETLLSPEDSWKSEELFYVVEEMPRFNDGEPIEFRRHITQNLRYPKEAIQHGVSGKVFIKFIVTKTGKVEIPDAETLASIEGKMLDEVVVISYRTLKEDDKQPEDKYIQLLKDEVVRVIMESPDWQPGKQKGKAVNVAFTFPVNFALQ